MSYQNLLLEVRDRIGRITVNRPEKLNALNRATVVELDLAFGSMAEDPSVGAVILTGSGNKAFVAGADINELARLSPVEGREFALFGQKVLHRIETLGKPVLAAVNGYALGGGCEIALACTLRIASGTAKVKAVMSAPTVAVPSTCSPSDTSTSARGSGAGRRPSAIHSVIARVAGVTFSSDT